MIRSFVALLALAGLVGAPEYIATAEAAEPPGNVAADTHVGTVVAAGSAKITVLRDDGMTQNSFNVGQSVMITLNGKPAKLEDLTQGDFVTVKTEPDGSTVTAIEAKSGKQKQR